MKWYKIKDNETLELFIVSSDEQPINSVLVTDENSTFVKPIANSIDFTEVVEGATKDGLQEVEEPTIIDLRNQLIDKQTEIEELIKVIDLKLKE